jgi:hypothetical protein
MDEVFLEHVILRQGTINVIVDSLLLSRAACRAAATACAEEDRHANGNNHQDDNENEPPRHLARATNASLGIASKDGIQACACRRD